MDGHKILAYRGRDSGTTVECNALTEAGFYQVYNGSNAPRTGWVTIWTIPFGNNNPNYVRQVAYSISDNRIYYRYCSAGNWSKWELNANIPTYLDATNIDTFVGSGADFTWGYGLINNIGYLAFNIGWITFQFKVDTWYIQKRIKYGNNAWTDWTTI